MNLIETVISAVNDALYGYILIIVLVLAGLYFTVRTKGKGTAVKRWKLNGKRLDRTYITHDEIMAGGVLEAELKK